MQGEMKSRDDVHFYYSERRDELMVIRSEDDQVLFVVMPGDAPYLGDMEVEEIEEFLEDNYGEVIDDLMHEYYEGV